ncbi:FprA family A-type flavoprotein [[Clostridium] fimetarium]|uniref:Flavorubredoxin n=1 Tax=[Clostridium] fimetarium TaxID=99656 RepID=A0A1I0RLE4_9FIRM|nr:FprA family A-type flavoprotein [[Clostridium] fimetarium]SEW41728.1 Flavorubredoxin [[Clostridium] fimetarium]
MKIAENVVYVGMQNPGMRNFDIIMTTGYGTTYNSYLIMGEKNVLIETVHNTYTKEYIEKIEEYVKISDIDYVILNHTEPDHSGSLSEILNMNPEIIVIGTAAAIKNLKNITNQTFKSQLVKQGDSLDIGNDQVFDFIIAPNLHWPDSMFTYYKKEKILFSCDVFGSHYCEQFLYDYQLKNPNLYEIERKNYYDCIFAPFKKFVLSGIEKIENLDIELICCSHGPILKTGIKETIKLYKKWSSPVEKPVYAAIFYVSAYGYTRQMAEIMKDCITKEGIKVEIFDLLGLSLEEYAAIMNDANAVLFGSPTINGDALEPIWNLIDKSVMPLAKGKPALVFGSYGWSGEACQLLSERLKGLRYNVFPTNLKVQFKPSDEDIQNIKDTMKEFIPLIK